MYGGFTAASAGAGEFKQRLQQLHVLHLRVRELVAIHFRKGEEEVPVVALGFAQRSLEQPC